MSEREMGMQVFEEQKSGDNLISAHLDGSFELIDKRLHIPLGEILRSSPQAPGENEYEELIPLQLRKELTFKRGYLKNNQVDSNAKC